MYWQGGRWGMCWRLKLAAALWVVVVGGDVSSAGAEPPQPIGECKSALDAGRFQEAVTACHRAVLENSDGAALPGNKVELLLLRAQAYENTSTPWKALSDRRSAWEFAPPGLKQKAAADLAATQIKFGSFDEARQLLAQADDAHKAQLQEKLKAAQEALDKTKRLIGKANWDAAEESARELAINLTPYWKEAHDLRVQALIKQRAFQRAIDAAKAKSRIEPESSATNLLVGKLYMVMGNVNMGKRFITECARLDPGNQQCLALRSRLKQIETTLDEAEHKMLLKDSVRTLKDMLGKIVDAVPETEIFFDKNFPDLFRAFKLPVLRLLCIKEIKVKMVADARLHCAEAKELDTANADFYFARLGEIALVDEKFDDAIMHFRKALKLNQRNEEFQGLLRKAENAKRERARTKYYDALGVPRDASPEQIKKAYQHLVRQYHPDKQKTDEDRQAAESKIYEINSAYSVLSDKDKRAQYDAGIDPNDPSGGAQNFYRGPHHGHAGGSVFFNMNFEDLFRQAGFGGDGRGGFGGRHGNDGFHYQHHRQQYRRRHTDDL